jgi:hypothetical protein
MRRVVVIAAIVAAAGPAYAERVKVEVVEVAGELAYLQPGEAAGLTIGTKVKFGKRTLTVAGVTRDFAAVRLNGARLSVGDRGVASVERAAVGAGGRRPAPRPLDQYRAQWPDAARPADAQTPEPVPLGAGTASGPLRAAGWASGLVIFAGEDDSVVALEAGTRLSYQPMPDRPLAADLDAQARVFSAGSRGARAPLYVRAAQVRWGSAGDPRVALGRLRWASSSTGMLDGARLSARLGAVELAAFGGLAPEPLDGGIDPSSPRFGVELAFDDPAGRWRPRLGVEAYGSTWDGELDERRLAVDVGLERGAVSLDGFAEAQSFAPENPWGAKRLEVTGAGAGVSWRRRGKHAGLDLTAFRPERSLRLAATLPPDWLCVRDEAFAGGDEPCLGGDFWASATASAGIARARWSLDAGGSVGATQGDDLDGDASGFALARLGVLPLRGHLELGASAGHAKFLDWASPELGVSLAPSRRLAGALRWRPEWRAYSGALEPIVVHSLLGDLRLSRGPTLDLAVSAGLLVGDDREALTLLTTLSWRPLP